MGTKTQAHKVRRIAFQVSQMDSYDMDVLMDYIQSIRNARQEFEQAIRRAEDRLNEATGYYREMEESGIDIR